MGTKSTLRLLVVLFAAVILGLAMTTATPMADSTTETTPAGEFHPGAADEIYVGDGEAVAVYDLGEMDEMNEFTVGMDMAEGLAMTVLSAEEDTEDATGELGLELEGNEISTVGELLFDISDEEDDIEDLFFEISGELSEEQTAFDAEVDAIVEDDIADGDEVSVETDGEIEIGADSLYVDAALSGEVDDDEDIGEMDISLEENATQGGYVLTTDGEDEVITYEEFEDRLVDELTTEGLPEEDAEEIAGLFTEETTVNEIAVSIEENGDSISVDVTVDTEGHASFIIEATEYLMDNDEVPAEAGDELIAELEAMIEADFAQIITWDASIEATDETIDIAAEISYENENQAAYYEEVDRDVDTDGSFELTVDYDNAAEQISVDFNAEVYREDLVGDAVNAIQDQLFGASGDDPFDEFEVDYATTDLIVGEGEVKIEAAGDFDGMEDLEREFIGTDTPMTSMFLQMGSDVQMYMHLDGEPGAMAEGYAGWYDADQTETYDLEDLEEQSQMDEGTVETMLSSFTITDAEFEDDEVTVEDEIEATATIENAQSYDGTKDVELILEDETVASEELSVDADGEETVTLTADAPDEADEYNYTVQTPDDSVDLTLATDDDDGIPGFTLGATAIAALLGILLLRRRAKKNR